jgi:serine/threonine-protein kinase
MHNVGPDDPPAGGAPAGDTDIERLFGLSDPAWIDRVRSAVTPRGLGRLGRYDLLEELGRGGQGEVYKAMQPGTGRPVALKRVASLGFAPSESLRARFASEVEALTRLAHPNVVTVHAAEVIDGHTVLVMELVEGRAIDRWADACWRTPDGAFRGVLTAYLGVCDGVAHAHARGVIHRDIKPSNVLVDAAGAVKVLDFGIAKVLDGQAGAYATVSGFLGTPGYAAPERFRGGQDAPDTRSDVYSLGVLLHRLLSGREVPAWVGPAGVGPAPTLGALPGERHLPRECGWIIAKATSSEPDRRYATVDALARDIRALLDGAAVEAAPPSAVYRLRKSLRRHRVAVGVTAGVMVMLAGATAYSIDAANRAAAALERENLALRASEAALAGEQAALAASRESERKALRDAQRQQGLANVLRTMLGGSGVVGGARPDITLREALDQAVVRHLGGIDDTGGHDPAVEAPLRVAVAETYLSIGRYDEAVAHLRKAVHLYEKSDDLGTYMHMSALYLLGRSLRNVSGGLEESERVLRRAVEFYQRDAEAWSLPLAETLTSLAITLRYSGKRDEALATYRRALHLYEREQGVDGPNAVTLRQNIAIMLSHAGQHEEAVRLMQNVADIRASRTTGATPELAHTYTILGSIVWAAGDAGAGEGHFATALAMHRELMPKPEAPLANTLLQLADWRDKSGRLDDALDPAREAYTIFEGVSGPLNINTMRARERVVGQLRRAGRLDEAQQICAAFMALDPPPRADTSALAELHARILADLDRQDDSAAAWDRAWTLLAGADPSARAALAERIAGFYAELADDARAASWREAGKRALASETDPQ